MGIGHFTIYSHHSLHNGRGHLKHILPFVCLTRSPSLSLLCWIHIPCTGSATRCSCKNMQYCASSVVELYMASYHCPRADIQLNMNEYDDQHLNGWNESHAVNCEVCCFVIIRKNLIYFLIQRADASFFFWILIRSQSFWFALLQSVAEWMPISEFLASPDQFIKSR